MAEALKLIALKTTQEKLFRYCLLITRSRVEAEDLVQDVNEKIIDRCNDGTIPESINQAYLSHAAYTTYIDKQRTSSRRAGKKDDIKYAVAARDGLYDLQPLMELMPERETVAGILINSKKLSLTEKSVMYWRWLEGFSMERIAREQNVALNTVLGIAFRSRVKLREEFKHKKWDIETLSIMLDGHDSIPDRLENMHIKLTANCKNR